MAEDQWYHTDRTGNQLGPTTTTELLALLTKGDVVNKDCYVWVSDDWAAIKDVPKLNPPKTKPPPLPPKRVPPRRPSEPTAIVKKAAAAVVVTSASAKTATKVANVASTGGGITLNRAARDTTGLTLGTLPIWSHRGFADIFLEGFIEFGSSQMEQFKYISRPKACPTASHSIGAASKHTSPLDT
jgi:hypothetical protein